MNILSNLKSPINMKNKFIVAILVFIPFLSNAQTPTTVFTPRGSSVPALIIPEMSQQQITEINSLAALQFPNTTRLDDASSTYNCHAYAWHLSEDHTNLIWINTPGDDTYWNDGSYYEICNVNDATKISYYSGDHSAIKSVVAGKYDSKWGNWPLLRHNPTEVPEIYVGVNRKYYAPTPDISGASTVCTSNTSFSIANPAGTTVSWSVSPTNLFAIDMDTGSSFTTRATNSSSSGAGTISATISGSCGTIVIPPKNVWVGNPGSVGTISGSNSVSQGQWVYYSVSSSIPNNGMYDWTLPSSGQPCLPPSTNCWYFLYGGDGLPYSQVSVGLSSGLVQVKRVNSCGAGPTSYKYVNVNSGGGGGGGGGGCCITPAIVSPNPATYELSVQYRDETSNLPVAETEFEDEVGYTLTDFMGNIVFSKSSKKTKQKLNISRVREDGVYILTIKQGDKGSEQHRIVIDR